MKNQNCLFLGKRLLTDVRMMWKICFLLVMLPIFFFLPQPADAFTGLYIDHSGNSKVLPGKTNRDGTVTFLMENTTYPLRVELSVDPVELRNFFNFKEIDLKTGETLMTSADYFLMPDESFKAGFWISAVSGVFYFSSDDRRVIEKDRLSEFAEVFPMAKDGADNLAKKRDMYFAKEGYIDFSGANALKFKEKYLRSIFQINTPSAIVVTHGDSQFDQGKTEASFRTFADLVRGRQVPVIGLNQKYEFQTKTSNVSESFFDFLGTSDTGAHRIRMPNLKSIVLTGGYIEQCLSETIQGFFRELRPNSVTNFIFPLELVYAANWKPIHDVFLPGLTAEEAKTKLSLATTLKELESLSVSQKDFEEKLSQFIQSAILGVNTENEKYKGTGKLSPYQADDEILLSNYKVELYLRNQSGYRKIGSIGDNNRTVRMIFTDMEHVNSYLEDSKGPLLGYVLDPDGKSVRVLPSRRTHPRGGQMKTPFGNGPSKVYIKSPFQDISEG